MKMIWNGKEVMIPTTEDLFSNNKVHLAEEALYDEVVEDDEAATSWRLDEKST